MRFEIFNRQSKGLKLPYSFLPYGIPCLPAKAMPWFWRQSRKDCATLPWGWRPAWCPDFPGLIPAAFPAPILCEHPAEKDGLPFEVTLQAYTPFIPLDDVNSGIPGIRFVYRLKTC